MPSPVVEIMFSQFFISRPGSFEVYGPWERQHGVAPWQSWEKHGKISGRSNLQHLSHRNGLKMDENGAIEPNWSSAEGENDDKA